MSDITEIKISDNKKHLFTGNNMLFQDIKGEICIGYKIGEKICDAMRNAKHSIKICVPYTSKHQLEYVFPEDAPFMDNVEEVLIVTCNSSIEEKKEHCPLEKLQSMDKLSKCQLVIYKDPYKKEGNHIQYDEYLMLHTKMYLIDDTVLFLSSGNFTRSGMNGNMEFYVKVDGGNNWQDKDLVDSVRILFEKLKTNPEETLKVKCCKLEDYDTQKKETETENECNSSTVSEQQ